MYVCEAVVCQQLLTDALEESYRAMKLYLRARNKHAQITVSSITTEKIHELNKTSVHAQKRMWGLRMALPPVDVNAVLICQ